MEAARCSCAAIGARWPARPRGFRRAATTTAPPNRLGLGAHLTTAKPRYSGVRSRRLGSARSAPDRKLRPNPDIGRHIRGARNRCGRPKCMRAYTRATDLWGPPANARTAALRHTYCCNKSLQGPPGKVTMTATNGPPRKSTSSKMRHAISTLQRIAGILPKLGHGIARHLFFCASPVTDGSTKHQQSCLRRPHSAVMQACVRKRGSRTAHHGHE